jgi:hypothetical protein
MGNASTADVINSFNAIIKANGNSGISWGNNNYPYSADTAGFFWGPNWGIAAQPDPASLGSGYQASASVIRNTLMSYARNYAYIRMVQVLVYRSGDNALLYNGTALGYSRDPVYIPDAVAGATDRGYPISLGEVNNYLWRIWQNYAAARAATIQYVAWVCHSNCHINRSRR